MKNLDKKPNITYNEWKKGISHVFNDIIDSQNKWDVFYRIISEIDTEKINKEYLPKNYREKRDKKELERYAIMSSNAAKNKKPRFTNIFFNVLFFSAPGVELVVLSIKEYNLFDLWWIIKITLTRNQV